MKTLSKTIGLTSGNSVRRRRWRRRLDPVLAGIAFLALALASAQAQWLTQTFDLEEGWNAVQLHVDASHLTLDQLVGNDLNNPIEEVWLWQPAAATGQFVQTPQEPIASGSQWAAWKRSGGGSSVLQRLVGNAAYLVYSTQVYTWSVQGVPVRPRYQWTTSGLNFLGFPTPPTGPPSFEAFLANVPELQENHEIYRYPGGPLGPSNPARIFAHRTTPVRRGEAFWIRSGTVFNRYFGPFELVSAGSDGIDFSDQLSVYSLRLRNLTAEALTVTLALVASETPPAGQPTIAGVPPMLVRGDLNTTDLTHGYATLPVGTPVSWVLAGKGQPGSEIEVVLGLDRSAITAAPGALLAGLLRFTDSLGHSQVDLPVSATVASSSGLWVGGAAVTQVGQYLKSYQRDADNAPVVDGDGRYVVTGINTDLGSVPRFLPLRLIVHNPASGGAVLLQRVFTGVDAGQNFVVATHESVLNRNYLAEARRISAVHLPWSEENTGWTFDGNLGDAPVVSTTVTTEFADQAANPFLHTYHPDHDNLDARFENRLPQGSESYTIERNVTLELTPPTDDFGSRTAAGRTIGGNYLETIRVLGLARAGGTIDTRQFEVRGAFTLNRIADVPSLTTP